MPCASFSKRCTWHRKVSAKNSSKLNKFLHSEVNILIQHIIVQDQDGQNNYNNRLNFAQRPVFSGLRFFNDLEISDSGPTDMVA